jgi:hypothetical protein
MAFFCNATALPLLCNVSWTLAVLFFFNVFPFPVEVATGKTFWNQWMFTSILYQLKVKAFLPAILMVAMFSLPFVGIKFWK